MNANGGAVAEVGEVVDLDRERRIRADLVELERLAAEVCPEAPERILAEWLAKAEEVDLGGVAGIEGGRMHKEAHRAVRVESELLARAEGLVPRFAASDWGKMVRASATSVVKLALIRGLAALEQELPELPPESDAKRRKR